MRIATIDIGTTSIHVVVAEIHADSSFVIIDREKDMIRLGAGGLDGRVLTKAATAAALRTLVRFRHLADAHRVDEIRAVATSAVREASNGGALLAAIERETGIRPRVITGIEEARLIHRAAHHGVEVGTGVAVVIDIGGGSTEVTLGTRDRVRMARSLKLGAIRLTERFARKDPIGASAVRRLVQHIRAEVGPFLDEVRAAGFDRVIGTSGTALNVGAIALGSAFPCGADIHHCRLPARQLHRTRKTLAALDLDQRLQLPGLESKRADLIVSGAILFDTIIRDLRADEVTLCDFALREGLVLDFIDRHRRRIARVDRYPDIRRRSVMELAERCRYRVEHTDQVVRLALSLYDQARELHALPDRAREWLEYGAILHDIGYHISFDRHQRHSYYLVRNGGLRGFDPDEVEAIALIARHHRRAEPRKSDQTFAALPGVVRRAVRACAAVLRVAESLDRSHAGVVDRVEIVAGGDGPARLVVHPRADAELELWAAARHLKPLEKAVGREVRLEAGDHRDAEHPDDSAPVPRQAVRGRGHRRLREDDPARSAG